MSNDGVWDVPPPPAIAARPAQSSKIVDLREFQRRRGVPAREIATALKILVRVRGNSPFAYFLGMVCPSDAAEVVALRRQVEQAARASRFFKEIVLADWMIHPVRHDSRLASHLEMLAILEDDETLGALEVEQDFAYPALARDHSSELSLQSDGFSWRVAHPWAESVHLPWDFLERIAADG